MSERTQIAEAVKDREARIAALEAQLEAEGKTFHDHTQIWLKRLDGMEAQLAEKERVNLSLEKAAELTVQHFHAQ